MTMWLFPTADGAEFVELLDVLIAKIEDRPDVREVSVLIHFNSKCVRYSLDIRGIANNQASFRLTAALLLLFRFRFSACMQTFCRVAEHSIHKSNG